MKFKEKYEKTMQNFVDKNEEKLAKVYDFFEHFEENVENLPIKFAEKFEAGLNSLANKRFNAIVSRRQARARRKC